MERWFALMLRHRVLVLLLLAATSGLAAWSTSRAVLASSIEKLFFAESPAWHSYRARIEDFGNDSAIVVGWEDPDPLAPTSLDRLDRVVAAVEEHPRVGAVHSLASAPWIRSEAGALRVDSWAEAARSEDGPNLRRALEQDASRGLFLDESGTRTAIIVELEPDEMRGEDGPPTVAEIMARVQAADPAWTPDDLHSTGFPPTLAEAVRQSYLNLARVLPVSTLLLLGTVYLLFRRMLPVLVTGGVALVAVLWTLGFATALDRELSLFTTITPAIILIVAFADVIHLYSAYLTELARGRPKESAILASAADVGVACAFTSITTFVGFVSLSFVPTPVFRQLGVVLGFGVAVALLLAMTLTPIVLSYLPAPTTVRQERDGPPQLLLDRLLGALRGLASDHPRAVIAAWCLVVGLSLYGASRIEVETDMLARLPPASKVQQDAAWFTEHFAGTSTFELYLESPEPEGMLDPDLLARLAAGQDRVEALAEVDQVGSLVDLLASVHGALGGAGSLPDTRAGVAQELLLFELAGGSELERFVDFDRRTLRLTGRLGATGAREVHRAAEAAEAELREALGPELAARGVTVEATGLVYLVGGWLDEILLGQKTGFAASFLVIAGLMALALRSLRAGLWSMLPNALPLLCLGGWVGLLWDKVDSDTFIVAMLAVGIGVDDTIHFLVRYRLEAGRARGPDPTAQALAATFAFAGRAIVITTVILVVGFLPFAMTGYFTTRLFGTMLPMVLVVALLADLLLVPAMVRVGWLRLGP